VPASDEQGVRGECVAEIIRSHGLTHFEEPVRLASGEFSQDFIDCKAALSRGPDLAVACRAMIQAVAALGIEFEAVGGLTMGADQLAHGISILAPCDWFVVRKEPKNRGTNRIVEGATLGVDTRVLLVDDVVTTGGSMQRAYDAITAIGAPVVAAATVVDRGEVARRFFDEQNVPYVALVTYRDLAIAPVGDPSVAR
jgi:orotate phosphoribosyltransferase